jgi:hypothetical protein
MKLKIFSSFFGKSGHVRDGINALVYSYIIVSELFMQMFAKVQKLKIRHSDPLIESSQLNNIVKKTGERANLWQYELTNYLCPDPGIDVMIKIFCEFRLPSAKKISVFLKNQCHDPFYSKLAVFCTKTHFFRKWPI